MDEGDRLVALRASQAWDRLAALRAGQPLPYGPESVDNAPMEGQAADDQALLARVQAKTRELYGGSPSEPLPSPFQKLEYSAPETVILARASADYTDVLVRFKINDEPFELTIPFPDTMLHLYRLGPEALGAVTHRVAMALLAKLFRK